MLPEVKKQWVADLRSGEFEQTKTRLWDEKAGYKRYCCLGVFMKRFEPDNPYMDAHVDSIVKISSGRTIPAPIREKYGLTGKLNLSVETTINSTKAAFIKLSLTTS